MERHLQHKGGLIRRSTNFARKQLGRHRATRGLQHELLEVRCVLSSLTLLDQSLFGGGGDQRGTALAIDSGTIYLSGNVQPENQTAAANALVISFATPTSNGAAPVWSRVFDYGTSFFGIAATNEGVYPVGHNYSLSSDGAGGKEVKSIAVKFTTDGSSGGGLGGSVWYNSPNFYGYRGVESFRAATAADVSGTTYVYAAGGAQPASYYAAVLGKFSTAGALVASATDPFVALPGASEARGVVTLDSNDHVIAAGFNNFGQPNSRPRPTLWEYDANVNFVQRIMDTSLDGYFNAITTAGNDLYAVGNTYNVFSPANSEDFLLQKFDAAGNRLWSTTTGGAGVDVLTSVVALGGKIYAAGYSNSSGAGGYDAVVLEVDPANGNVLATARFGGAQDDMANGIATDGTFLYVVGESKSFAQGGNAVGQNDVLLLRLNGAYNPSPVQMVGNDLVAQADTGNNRLVFSLNNNGDVVARLDTSVYGPFTVAGKIIAHGGDGNDVMTVASSVTVPVEFYGDGGDDYLAGGPLDDLLVGGPGNDRLLGGEGNNTLYGDEIAGELPTDGDDRLYGRTGNDVMFGGGGSDQLSGDAGSDVLHGGSGNDYLHGGLGDDLLRGGAGDDVLAGYYGHDILLGEAGNDQLSGDFDRDLLIGGLDIDRLLGGAEEDILIGGTTSHDANDAALMAIMTEWKSGNLFAARVANITSGSTTGGVALNTSTVLSDNRANQLRGDLGADWLLAGVADLLTTDASDQVDMLP